LHLSRLQGGTLTDRKLPLAVIDETILDYPPPLAPCRVQASGETLWAQLLASNWSGSNHSGQFSPMAYSEVDWF
jgi:hypothetical protein